MSRRQSSTTTNPLTLYRYLDNSHSVEQTANHFNMSKFRIHGIILYRERIEQRIARTRKRRNLSNKEKIIVAQFLLKHNSIPATTQKFKLTRSVVHRIRKDTGKIEKRVEKGEPLWVKRPLRAEYRNVEEEV